MTKDILVPGMEFLPEFEANSICLSRRPPIVDVVAAGKVCELLSNILQILTYVQRAPGHVGFVEVPANKLFIRVFLFGNLSPKVGELLRKKRVNRNRRIVALNLHIGYEALQNEDEALRLAGCANEARAPRRTLRRCAHEGAFAVET